MTKAQAPAGGQARPRVLYLIHSYQHLAGTELHARDLRDALSVDWETWVAFRHDGDRLCVLEPSGATEFLPCDPPLWPVTPYRQPRTEASLQALLARIAPDVIHVQHFILWPLSVLDIVTATRTPVVLSLHDYYAVTPEFTMRQVIDARHCFTSEYAERVFGEDISPYLRERHEILQRSLRQVAAVVAPSKYAAAEVAKVFELRVQVIEHGIRHFAATPRRGAPPRNGGLIFGYVGSLLPQKGWDQLVRAFAIARRRYPEIRLHLWGGTADLPPELAPQVAFFGAYAPSDLPSILSGIDVGVIPSVFAETFSLTLSELWHAGLPVAVAAIGALSERVVDGVNGRTFPPGDVDALASRLLWFVDNPEWREWHLPPVKDTGAMAAEYDALYRRLVVGTARQAPAA